MVAALFWFLIAVFCLAVEVHTNAFVAVFAGFGAAFTFVLALSGVSFLIQVATWLGLSVVTLLALRPLAIRRYRHRRTEVNLSLPSHAVMTDSLGFVEVPVGNALQGGRVRIKGESWMAVTNWPEVIAEGTPIVVRQVLGTTLWVDPL